MMKKALLFITGLFLSCFLHSQTHVKNNSNDSLSNNSLRSKDSANHIFTVDDLDTGIILENWKISFQPEPNWVDENFIDTSWKDDRSQFSIFNDTIYTGEAWFRKRLLIDSTLLFKPLNILINTSDHVKIYVDGVLLGSYGKALKEKDSSNLKINHSNFIVFRTAGKHDLCVHFKELNYSKSNILQLKGFSFSILTEQEYTAKTNFYQTYQTQLWIISIISLTLGLIHLLLYLYYKENKTNLLLALYFLFSFIGGISYYLNYASLLSIEGLTFSSNSLSQMSIIFGLLSVFSFKTAFNLLYNFKKRSFIIYSIIVIIAILGQLIFSTVFTVINICLVILFYIQAYIIVFKAAFKKKEGAKTIAVPFLINLVFMFIVFILSFKMGLDTAQNKDVAFDKTILFTSLVSLIMPLGLTIYLAKRFASINKNLKKKTAQIADLTKVTLQQEEERKSILENKRRFLEEEVKFRTKELEQQNRDIEKHQLELIGEKNLSESLLLNILPHDVMEELKENGESLAKQFENVSILFSDFTNIQDVSTQLSSQELIDELNHCFKGFDEIVHELKIEKIKTIGHSYMAVSGLPKENLSHAHRIIEAALQMRQFINIYQLARKQDGRPYFQFKCGIHTGEVVAGIVGIKKYAYDIWGDAVNTAARVKGKSENNKICISQEVYELTKNDYLFMDRGKFTIKGKGEMNLFYLEPNNN